MSESKASSQTKQVESKENSAAATTSEPAKDNKVEQPINNCIYAFRIAAAMEEIHSRCRQAKIFVPVEIALIINDLNDADQKEGSQQKVLEMWFPSMTKRDIAEAVKFALKQAKLWDESEIKTPLQELIQFKHHVGSILEEIHPTFNQDRREFAQVVELVMAYVGDSSSLSHLVTGLRQLYNHDASTVISLRHPVGRLRMELEHRHHSNISIIETLARWFRSKTLSQMAEICCTSIDKFCPNMEKDYLVNLNRGYDNLDVLLQTEQIILETGAHMYLESSDALLDAEKLTHSKGFSACLQAYAPGFETIITDPELNGLKAQLQSFKRWRRLYIYSDPNMIESDIPLERKQAIIQQTQAQVDHLLAQAKEKKSRGPNASVAASSDPKEVSEDVWDASIKFTICGHDPKVPLSLMRTSEEGVVVERWPQYVGAWRRFQKFNKMDSYCFRHSHTQLVKHFNATVGNLQVQGLWNVLQVPEMIKEAVKIRGWNDSEHRPRTVKEKMVRIWQQVAKWPCILNLPVTLSQMSGGMLNGYKLGDHPDLPTFFDTLAAAKKLFFAEPDSPPPRAAPPLLIYHSAIPAGRKGEKSSFIRRSIHVSWVATDSANQYKLEYGRLARRVDWRRVNGGKLLPTDQRHYKIGESEDEKLQEMVEYVVRLRAINQFGNGPWVRANVFAGRREFSGRSRGTSQNSSRYNSRQGSSTNSRDSSRERGGRWRTPQKGSAPNSRSNSPGGRMQFKRNFNNDIDNTPGPTPEKVNRVVDSPVQEVVWAQLKESLQNQLPGARLRRQKSHDEALSHLPKALADKVPTEAPFQAFVGGLEYALSEDDVWQHFDDKCHIENVRLLRDDKNRSKGFCFIDFYDRASLIACLAEDGTPISGRPIKVNVADHPIASKESSRSGSRNGSRRGSRPGSRNGSRRGSRNSSPNRTPKKGVSRTPQRGHGQARTPYRTPVRSGHGTPQSTPPSKGGHGTPNSSGHGHGSASKRRGGHGHGGGGGWKSTPIKKRSPKPQ